MNGRNILLCSDIPEVLISVDLSFLHCVYRKADDYALPLLLIPSVPVSLVSSDDGLVSVIILSLKNLKDVGFTLDGSLQSCNITIDLYVILKMIRFVDQVLDRYVFLVGILLLILKYKVKTFNCLDVG